LLSALEISIKIYEDSEICELEDYKEHDKVDVHISADTFVLFHVIMCYTWGNGKGKALRGCALARLEKRSYIALPQERNCIINC